MTRQLVGHYQLTDPQLSEDEQQELEDQLNEAAIELDVPIEVLKEYYRQSFQEQPLDSNSGPIVEDEFCLGVHLPSWHAGYRKCLEIIQEHIKNDI